MNGNTDQITAEFEQYLIRCFGATWERSGIMTAFKSAIEKWQESAESIATLKAMYRRGYDAAIAVGAARATATEQGAERAAALERIKELAHEWSAKYPLGGDMDEQAAGEIYIACQALSQRPNPAAADADAEVTCPDCGTKYKSKGSGYTQCPKCGKDRYLAPQPDAAATVRGKWTADHDGTGTWGIYHGEEKLKGWSGKGKLLVSGLSERQAKQVEAAHNAEFRAATRRNYDAEPHERLLDELERVKEAAEKLCKIYFEIAAEAIGEEAVRAKRDEMIKKKLAKR